MFKGLWSVRLVCSRVVVGTVSMLKGSWFVLLLVSYIVYSVLYDPLKIIIIENKIKTHIVAIPMLAPCDQGILGLYIQPIKGY